MIAYDLYKKVSPEVAELLKQISQVYLPLDQSGVIEKSNFETLRLLAAKHQLLLSWSELVTNET